MHERPQDEFDCLALLAFGCSGVVDGIDNRHGGEHPRDDREQNRAADSDERDECDREQRPPDRAKVVHRSLESVGTSVGDFGNDVGQELVAGGDAQAASGPRPRAEHPDLPGRAGSPDQS